VSVKPTPSPQFIVAPRQAARQPVLVALTTYDNDPEAWLAQAIESVLTQTFTDFALLLVINGPVAASKTSMLLKCAEQDERIVVAQNENNEGLAACMNQAIDWMLGYDCYQFFVRMDADDICHPERLLKQYNFMQSHKKVAILGTALTEIDEAGRKVGSRVMPASNNVIVRMLPRRCTLNHPTVMMRREVFRQGHRYDSQLMNTQDYFLWIELAAAGYEFRNLRERLLEFRRVNDFYKRRGLAKSVNEFKARFQAMRCLHRFTLFNVAYACSVLMLRLMPAQVIKLAYKLDRVLLEKIIRH